MTKPANMYSASVAQWSPAVGCRFNCSYCRRTFQAQTKRRQKFCAKCGTYEPHEHPERLDKVPARRTPPGKFIFTCACGDIAFCSTKFLQQIVDRIRQKPTKTFLLQSKRPWTFTRVEWPQNVILGITIETNWPTTGISLAPLPIDRYHEFVALGHPRKMLTIEPIMEFDLGILSRWAIDLHPEQVWIGYDRCKTGLPEPELAKTMELRNRIQAAGIPVHLKRMRERTG